MKKKPDCKALTRPVQDRALRSPNEPRAERPDPTKRRPGSLSRSILGALLLCLSSVSASASITVTGLLSQITSEALETYITFTPSADILLLNSGLSAGPAKTIFATNGAFSQVLNPGTYLVRLPRVGGRNAFTIGVPHGTSTENITNLIAAPWTYEQFTNTVSSIGVDPATVVAIMSTNNAGSATAATSATTATTATTATWVASPVTNAWQNSNTNINNSLYGLDSDALIYCNARGISNLGDMFKIDGFVRTRKAGGIWSLMVDTWILRSNLNSINLTNAISWNGKQHTVYGSTAPRYDETGLTFTFNGSGALWLTNLPDMRTNTVFAQVQIDAATWDQTNPFLVLQNGPIDNSFAGSYLACGVLNSGNSGVQWRQGNGGSFTFCTYEDHHRLKGFGLAGSFPSDFPRIYTTSVSNTTWNGWFENIPAGAYTFTPLLPQSANSMASSGPLTNMIIGARVTAASPPFNSFGGKVQVISIFNRPLTQNEIEIENRALRCLDPQDENWVFYGDSRMAGYSFDVAGAVGDQRGCFVNALVNQLGNVNARFVNMSVPAINLDEQNASTNLLRSVAFYAPDGRNVKKTRAFVLASAFNQFNKASPPTVLEAFNSTSNLCAQIRKMGIEVNLFTEAPISTSIYATNSSGTGWTNFASAYNLMVITNAGMYDRLFRYDLAMDNYQRTTNSGYYTDGVHASAAGNRKWAAFTAKQLAGANDTFDTVSLFNQGTNVALVSPSGSIINGISFTNGVLSGSGLGLTNPPYAVFSEVWGTNTLNRYVAAAAWTNIWFTTNATYNFDNTGAFTLSNSFLIVNTAGAGRWRVRGHAVMRDSTGGNDVLSIRIRRHNNTATTLLVGDNVFVTYYSSGQPSVVGVVTLTAGDIIAMQVYGTAASDIGASAAFDLGGYWSAAKLEFFRQ